MISFTFFFQLIRFQSQFKKRNIKNKYKIFNMYDHLYKSSIFFATFISNISNKYNNARLNIAASFITLTVP